MDFSHILNTSLPQKDKLLAYGFTQTQNTLVLQSPLQEKDFYALITLDIKNQKLTAQVYETSTKEKYWITILLTAVTDFEKLCDLTRQSYTLVEKKK